MAILQFPNPRHTNTDGILALGGDLEPESLLLAYRQGIFPWPIEGLPLAWFCPLKRAILEWDRIHRSRSLVRAQKKSDFRFTMNQAFSQVIQECAATPRPFQSGTWITEEMIQAYIQFHHLGYAHSIEVWQKDVLVGGIYGVSVEGTFAGESMFYKASNASKLAILHLMEYLHTQGLDWMDIQVLTPHMEQMGAREISRDEFLLKLKETQNNKLKLFSRL